jgi:transposase
MGKVTKAVEHLTLEEIDEKIKTTVGFWRVKRWMVIRHALANPVTAKEMALNTGMAEQSIHNLVAAYNREGEKAVEAKGKGQRQKANLTIEEEKEFLKPFFEKAEKGLITTAGEIKKSLEIALGHSVHKTTVYRLLDRHGWRKIAPRPAHPKTNKEEQETFKKTSGMK